ncbi:elongation factor P [Candidatus Desantisbacteria bacterium CG07_land_8_20_14_0_80_39_15]|uniref:Elongation factor P n=1 Tax=Candidatus Desantisbacteria bacterium CG07_land_8_20_14_0_80_39_15 TaxID=1974549 RepID=A0A2M6ZIP0_9BACT|nr:MAG: elongation factor P [Candidatus Desantisbacteria bacterium CG07_land_8_20_14_0_80_39_15]
MISAGDARKGIVIGFEDRLYYVVEFQHVKPGKGGAFVRLRMKDIKSGAVIDRTFRPQDTFEEIHIDERNFQYLYKNGTNFIFMDTQSYEQISFSEAQIGDDVRFLKEGLELKVMFYKEKEAKGDELQSLGIELPKFIELKVINAPPGLKGNTVSSPTKEVILETGFKLQVPLFIEKGDLTRINTSTGEYAGRG